MIGNSTPATVDAQSSQVHTNPEMCPYIMQETLDYHHGCAAMLSEQLSMHGDVH